MDKIIIKKNRHDNDIWAPDYQFYFDYIQFSQLIYTKKWEIPFARSAGVNGVTWSVNGAKLEWEEVILEWHGVMLE